MIRRLIREILLLEGRLEDVKKKYGTETDGKSPLPDKVIDKLAAGDPSGNYKYLMWMAKEAWKGRNPSSPADRGESRSPEDIIKHVHDFHKNKDRLKKKDLYQYDSPEELRVALSGLSDSKRQQKKQAKTGGSEVVYNSNNYLVIFMKDHKAVCHYGKGTRWCITQDEETFLSYLTDYNFFYFIITKQPKALADERRERMLSAGIEFNPENFDKVAAQVIMRKNEVSEVRLWDATDKNWVGWRGNVIFGKEEWTKIEKAIRSDAETRPRFKRTPEQKIEDAVDTIDSNLQVDWHYDKESEKVSWHWNISFVGDIQEALVRELKLDSHIENITNKSERYVEQYIPSSSSAEVDVYTTNNDKNIQIDLYGDGEGFVYEFETFIRRMNTLSIVVDNLINL